MLGRANVRCEESKVHHGHNCTSLLRLFTSAIFMLSNSKSVAYLYHTPCRINLYLGYNKQRGDTAAIVRGFTMFHPIIIC